MDTKQEQALLLCRDDGVFDVRSWIFESTIPSFDCTLHEYDDYLYEASEI